MRLADLRLRVVFCLSLVAPALVSNGFSAGTVQETFEKEIPLTAEGRFELHNVTGSVRIAGWDKPSVRIHAVKSAANAHDLAAIQIMTKSKPDRLVLETKLPKKGAKQWEESNSLSVEYEIQVPAECHLEGIHTVNGDIAVAGVSGKMVVSTVNGRITAKDLASDSTLKSINGDLEARPERLTSMKTMSLATINGQITIVLPAKPDARIQASTLTGAISSGELKAASSHGAGQKLGQQLGFGGTQIKAKTLNGNIRVERKSS